MVSQNNDGNYYEIAVDTAKEGAEVWSLNDWFKARVGDEGTPLVMRFYTQGQLNSFDGHQKPIIQGNVGAYSFDENKQIVMAADAKVVSWTGDPSDMLPGGRARFRFPQQMFPTEGAFYGFVGYVDESNGRRLTGVNVWFRVLGGVAQMGRACDFYINDLDIALANAKEKMRQAGIDFKAATDSALQDLQTKYQQEVAANQAASETTRAGLSKLADSVGAIQAQIDAGNVVTLIQHNADIKRTSEMIENKLAQMSLIPETFENSDAIKNAYPNGKTGIMVAVDTGHKWIYVSGAWKDCGVYQAAGVDPNIKKALANTDHDNLLPNPTFKSLDGWNITTTDSTVEPDYSITENGFENSNVLTVNGYGSLLDEKSWTNVVSDPIVVESGQFITFGAMYNFKDQMINDQQPNVNIELDVLDNSKKVLNKNYVYSAPDADNDLHSRTRTIKLPGEAGYIQMKFQINGPGSFKVAQPQVNYGFQFVSNSVGQLQKSVQSENLLFDNPVKNWQMVWYTDSKMYFDQLEAVKVVSDSKNTSVLESKLFRQRPGDSLTLKLEIQASDGVQLHIREYDDNLTQQNEQVFLVEKNDKLSNQFFEDIKLGNATTIVQIALTAAPNRSFTVAKAIAKNTGFSEKYDASLKSLVNRNNLIKNSSLTSLSGWSLYSTKKGFYPDYRFYSNPDSQDDNIIEINGYGNFNNDDSYVHLKSDPISVKGGKLLSFGSLHNSRTNEGKNTQSNASIKLSVMDTNGSEIKKAFVYYIPDTDDDLHLRQNTVVLPDNASSVVLDFMIVGPGTFKMSEPQINYGPSLNPKIDSQVIRNIKNGDLLADNPVSNWQPIWFTGQKKYADDESTFLTTLDGTATPLQSEYIPVFPGDTFDVQALIKTSGHVYLSFDEYDQNLKQLSVTKIDANQSDDYKIQYFRNLTASSGTAYIAISFAVVGAKSSYNLKKVKLIKTSSLNDNASENVSTNNLLVPKFSITNDLSSLSDGWEKSSFTYEENDRSIKGYLQVGIQGFSSREWRKKNYKVKLYEDADCTKKLKIAFKPSWVPDSHFNLKANFIDATQAHNLVNAKLFANATAVTPIANETTRKGLSKSTQLGQMAGFPVELYVNGTYMGLYTLNTKKDEKSFGMDNKNKAHEALEFNSDTDMFTKGQTIDQNNVATIIQKQADTNVKAGFDRFIAFLNDATDDDIKAHLQDYVDVKSAMNTWLFGILSQESDIWGRSMLLLTYDGGQYWFVTAYDLDATWGLSWDGKSLDGNAEWFKFENIDSEMHKTGAWYNKLWTRIYDNFKPELKNQYQYLRSNAWSTQALINAYRTYIDAIPDSVYEKDHKRYPDIPSLSTNNFAQIQGKIIERCTNMDAWIDKLA